ncbi:MFS transporter [Solibacillus sp. A46]|uniref:MFS transporter n=1 Tax=Solibacillus faecavium TaxID=2762221 RepID=A0ABR8Y326_9BACL|nr:MFS transporter [Solibacillus faecavium]MBD8038615.1 MFS transporter [Solibacillus faecavium]
MSATIEKQSNPVYPIMVAIGICHLINDTMQAVIPAMFPLLERDLGLTFTQLGMISFVLNIFASLLQPAVGFMTDKKPFPYALPIGMVSSFIGLSLLILSGQYWMILVSVIFLGIGSAIFHPEGSRVSFMAAGNKRGLAQSIYQVGGNSGQALAPLLSAFLILPFGMNGVAYILIFTSIGIFLLTKISMWYKRQLDAEKKSNIKKVLVSSLPPLTKNQVKMALTVLLLLIFARSFYVTNITNFYVFYLIEQYGMSVERGQLFIFVFMAFGVVGTFFGGPLSDRFGRKNIILLSVIAPIPFCLALPFIPLPAVLLFLIIIGMLIMISFTVTVVYAQELVPSKIGTMAGLTIGVAFGMGAIGSIVIGKLIDEMGIHFTMNAVSVLTLLLFVAFLLPRDQVRKAN